MRPANAAPCLSSSEPVRLLSAIIESVFPLLLDHTGKAKGRQLYVYLGSASSARNSQFVRHSHKLRQRSRAHLVHDLAPMNPDCDLAGAEVGGCLLVRVA